MDKVLIRNRPPLANLPPTSRSLPMSASRFPRYVITSLALVAAGTGCAKGGERPAAADSSAAPTTVAPSMAESSHGGMQQMPATGTASAASAPAPTGSQKPKIDPKNVGASIVWDAATKTATIPLVSGLTPNAGGWNFDGYARGETSIIVPVGTKVVMKYYNDDIVPHSAVVVAGTASTVPSAPGAPVFAGATTTRADNGLMTGGADDMRFTADKAGKYLIVCGIPGHAQSGMWVWFDVSSGAKAPSVRTTAGSR